jgi:aspartyl/asparaginyl-tRNA synthetase
VAIGTDRLLMSQMQIDNIEGVILFPFSDMII